MLISVFLLELRRIFSAVSFPRPIPVATRSKAYVCGHSLAGIAASNPTEGMDVLSLVSAVCCQVEVPALG